MALNMTLSIIPYSFKSHKKGYKYQNISLKLSTILSESIFLINSKIFVKTED